MKAKPLLKTGVLIGAAALLLSGERKIRQAGKKKENANFAPLLAVAAGSLGLYVLRRALPYSMWIHPVAWALKRGLALRKKEEAPPLEMPLPENVTPLFR